MISEGAVSLTSKYFSSGSVDSAVTFLEGFLTNLNRSGMIINFQFCCSTYANLTRLAGNQGGVRDTPPRAVKIPSAAIIPRKSSVKFPAEQVKPCLFWQPQPPALHLAYPPGCRTGPAGNRTSRGSFLGSGIKNR